MSIQTSYALMRVQSSHWQVTLEEFKSLMKGELSGRDPMEAVLAVFAALSRPPAGSGNRNSTDPTSACITLETLRAACSEFEVIRHPLIL